MKRLLSLILVLLLLLAGCQKSDGDAPDAGDVEVPESGEALQPDFQQDEKDMFTGDDQQTDFDKKNSTVITLTGKTATCDDKTVGISGGTVTILAAGTYVLSGTLNDCAVVVNAGKKDDVHIVLNGVSITSQTAAPL